MELRKVRRMRAGIQFDDLDVVVKDEPHDEPLVHLLADIYLL
jgi:hypothetical protein